MTSSIPSDKHLRPESDIALEATHLIQRVYKHILNDNCECCRNAIREALKSD
jgi:hypothetical protein